MNKFIATALISFLTAAAFANSLPVSQPGNLYYHLTFPVRIDEKTESIRLDANYTDLIMSNFVAGALYSYLLHQEYPSLQLDEAYISGSLFAQLLQENLQTSDYQASTPWINPNPDIRKMLLAPGQGGPYQLNDYSKRLEHKIGMINFAVLQKSLGYAIEDQDSGVQTRKTGPASLDDKYFGPLAAAYFQFNDMLRIQSINQDPWGPSAQYFSACLKALESSENNFLDMILNATYNAGPWADITKTYIEICANSQNPAYAQKIRHINDYQLGDSAYQQSVGTHESTGSTFILYPRQIRFYLDQLYNNETGLNTHHSIPFALEPLKQVFASSLSTLAYVNKNGAYEFISAQDARQAFESARESLHLSVNQALDLGNAQERKLIFSLLQTAIRNLSLALNINFAEVTERNLNS
ncbi:hypothetical protein AQUSIP_07390 [Aquicella siphonis]|uniref:Imelysin-like domain-containing protein n=1 Tax=Aquicella siphonis TaxID=254247 RepID=A0A5E4PEN9_9COXI|nr:hypothetical protein [Aquicella siphonis]VVC75449.1 hypothetical protein AQUSIP_07390 [Aquicella siphonis]